MFKMILISCYYSSLVLIFTFWIQSSAATWSRDSFLMVFINVSREGILSTKSVFKVLLYLSKPLLIHFMSSVFLLQWWWMFQLLINVGLDIQYLLVKYTQHCFNSSISSGHRLSVLITDLTYRIPLLSISYGGMSVKVLMLLEGVNLTIVHLSHFTSAGFLWMACF